MNASIVTQLVKERLGVTTAIRDRYLTAIVRGVIDELENENGIHLKQDSYSQLMFVVDYATWRYQSRDKSGRTPRHLQFRLHNLVISGGSNV